MKKLLFTLLLAAVTLPGWADEYYLVGGCTDSGWNAGEYNRSAVRAYSADGTNWAWAGYISAASDDNDGRFKIPNSAGGWDGFWAPEQNKVITAQGVDLSTSSSGDNKFRLAETGYYLITFNTSDKKIYANKLTAPSKDGDYFLISSVDDYYYFAAYIATDDTKNAKARLTADLSFQEKTFVPLASDKHKFGGEFDGNGHTIDYAVVTGSYRYIGLFTHVTDGANIHDLVIGEHSSFTGHVKVGGIAGYARDGGTVTLTNVVNKANVTSTGGATQDEGNTAGLIGIANDNTIINATNCGNMGTVTGQDGQCAAFCGWSQDSGGETPTKSTYTNCWNSGTINNVESTAQLYRNSGLVTATNCYDASASTSRGQGTLLATNAVASGELAIMLNARKTSGSDWYQTVGTDTHPFPFSSPSHAELTLTPTDSWYEIAQPWQLRWMAEAINEKNSTYGGANYKLTADIDYSAYTSQVAMIGKLSNVFAGTFDGQNHTVTVAFNNTTAEGSGLFFGINNGTVRNLKVDGTITTTKKLAGGICSGIWERGTIENCESAVTINDNGSDDATHGGILAVVRSTNESYTINIQNCLFSGTLNAPGRTGSAGIVGWTGTSNSDNVKVKNCLVTGTLTIANVNTNGVIVRSNCDGENNYYTCTAGSNLNKDYATEASAKKGTGELCYRLNGLSVTSLNWYQTLGTDDYPVPFSSHGEMVLSQNEGWYEISEPWQLRWMAEAVNTKNGTYKSAQIKLINDIDYTAYTTQAAMLGAHLNPFSGTLDGQFHSIKVAFNNTTATEETALVRQLSEGTVKNLKVTGTITANQKLAGGICASIFNSGTIMNCESAVTIKDNASSSTDRTHGGILARVYNEKTDVTIRDCLFSGKFDASHCYGCGGVVGWTSNSDKVKITNCLVTGILGFENNAKNSVIAREDDTHAVLTNCYFTSDVSELGNVNKNKLARTTLGFDTGELCFSLNGTSGGTNWTQTIGTDTYPIPFNTSMLVFKNDDTEYDNIEKDGDWYKISNANELKLFSSKVNGGSTALKARLTADITASSDFAPIGNNTKWYTGEFDGAYHTITLALNNTTADYQGLFGTIADGAYIHDVTVAGSVKGRAYVAGVVAGVRGNSGEVNIFNCKNEATITGTGVNAAGIVGVNMNENDQGYCTTNISYCSNTGNVTGGSQSALISGWIGNGSITYSFAIGEIKGNDLNKQFARYKTCSFGENSTTTNVTMTGSTSTGGAKYFNPADATYSIGDVETFLTIATMVNVGGLDTKNFTLTSDIDLTDKTFIPIGTASYRYKGTFDGGGNKVTLDIDNETEERQGLFGYATGGATFQNLIVDGTVNCGGNSAALIGEVGGPGQTGVITIRKVGCEATVTGHGNNVGAFIGNDWGASMRLQVENSYNIGDVSVTSGNNYSTVMGFWVSNTSTFTNVYNSGNLSGGSVFQFAVYNGDTGNDTYTNCYLSPTSDQLTSGELCFKLGTAFTQDLSQANSYPTFGSETVGGGQWFGDDYIYYNVDESGNITVNELNLDDTKTAYNVPANVTAKSVTLTRTLHALTADGTQSRWNTFCSPVAIAKSNFSAAKELTGVKANGNNYSMTFTDVEGNVLEAGKPYMVQVSENTDNLTASNVAVAAAGTSTSSETFNGLTFTGNFTNGNAPLGSFIISNNVFYNVDSPVTLNAFRGYITTASGTYVKALTFDFDDDATSLFSISSPEGKECIYNLAGQRIQKMQKGINIVNGRKVLF